MYEHGQRANEIIYLEFNKSIGHNCSWSAISTVYSPSTGRHWIQYFALRNDCAVIVIGIVSSSSTSYSWSYWQQLWLLCCSSSAYTLSMNGYTKSGLDIICSCWSSKDISRTSNRTEIFFGDDDDVAEWLGNLFFAIPYVVANRIESTAGKFYYRSMVAADKSCKPGPAISYCHLKKPHLTPQSALVGGC